MPQSPRRWRRANPCLRTTANRRLQARLSCSPGCGIRLADSVSTARSWPPSIARIAASSYGVAVAMLIGVVARVVVRRQHPPRGPRSRGAARHRHDGPGDDAPRRERSARVHHLPRAAHRRAAVAGLATSGARDPRHRGSALLRSQRHRRRPRRRRGVEQRAAKGVWRRAAARSRSSSRDRASSRPTRRCAARSPRSSSRRVSSVSSPRTRSSGCISTRSTSATGSTASRRRRSATSASTRPRSRVAAGRAARRAGQGAVDVRADGQRRTRARAAQRRAPGDARREGDRSPGPTTPPCASR